jgi:hypothetical protein
VVAADRRCAFKQVRITTRYNGGIKLQENLTFEGKKSILDCHGDSFFAEVTKMAALNNTPKNDSLHRGGKQSDGGYTMQAEAARILDALVSNPKLNVPEKVKEQRSRLEFDGEETQPFYPTPYKAAESQAAVLGLVGLFAAAISKERYDIDQEIEIDL